MSDWTFNVCLAKEQCPDLKNDNIDRFSAVLLCVDREKQFLFVSRHGRTYRLNKKLRPALQRLNDITTYIEWTEL